MASCIKFWVGEIKALQSEVHSLRERLHAADDWMAMAVDCMNTMASENQSSYGIK